MDREEASERRQQDHRGYERRQGEVSLYSCEQGTYLESVARELAKQVEERTK